MYIGFYNFYSVYNSNRMFKKVDSPIGDDLGFSFRYLQEEFERQGHKVATIDTDDLEKFDAVVFLDYPMKLNKFFRKLTSSYPKIPLYLILYECEILRKDNWISDNHKNFKKIFTWKSTIIDNEKYFKINYSNKNNTNERYFDINIKNKFCNIIAGHKYNDQNLELYSKRVEAIRWFEKKHSDEFDLYGIGWDRIQLPWKFVPPIVNHGLAYFYRKFKFLPKFNIFPSYRGPVKSKQEVLKNYKFSICYENAILPGYITEKIFDCLFAGVIPVYWGAPDITNFIPANCFIDKRNFDSYEKLYEFMKNLSLQEHQQYLNNILEFLKSEKAKEFYAERFTEVLLKEIINAK